MFARNQDWIHERYVSAIHSPAGDAESFSRVSRYSNSWVETGNELEVTRKSAQRSGVSATPPDEWTDKYSQFSDERLKDDSEYDLTQKRE